MKFSLTTEKNNYDWLIIIILFAETLKLDHTKNTAFK